MDGAEAPPIRDRSLVGCRCPKRFALLAGCVLQLNIRHPVYKRFPDKISYYIICSPANSLYGIYTALPSI
ncbi:capsid protein [Dirofilaria immitis]